MYPEYAKYSGFFLDRQVECLSTLGHSLSLIIFVVADGLEVFEDFEKALASVPDRIGGAEVVVLRRPNGGMSYGSFLHATEWLHLKARGVERGIDRYLRAPVCDKRYIFDNYLFLEDDYFFCLPDFDTKLIEARDWHVKRFGECEYLCGLLASSRAWNICKVGFQIAGMSCGILSGRVVGKLLRLYREPRNGYLREWLSRDGSWAQVTFSYLFHLIGARIFDFGGFYDVRFRGRHGVRGCHGSKLVLIAANEFSLDGQC